MKLMLRSLRIWTVVLMATVPRLWAQGVTVTAQAVIVRDPASRPSPGPSDVVVWLTPVDRTIPAPDIPQQHPSLTQRNKSFEPHLLVVPVGTIVDFPNRDPFFHNVFSLFDGKRFDLGLYETGTTRYVRFDRPGVCYIFCNIHPQMSAVVIVLDSPYYAIATRRGTITIPDVPPGRYMLHVWDERSLPDQLAKLTREIVVSPSQPSLGSIQISETALVAAHKNKYGRDYDPPEPRVQAYPQP
jgi:hypothetical protein